MSVVCILAFLASYAKAQKHSIGFVAVTRPCHADLCLRHAGGGGSSHPSAQQPPHSAVDYTCRICWPFLERSCTHARTHMHVSKHARMHARTHTSVCTGASTEPHAQTQRRRALPVALLLVQQRGCFIQHEAEESGRTLLRGDVCAGLPAIRAFHRLLSWFGSVSVGACLC